MDGLPVICTIFITVVAYTDFCMADREYMMSTAEAIMVSIDDETTLECLMNIQPDNFQWKFYPLDKKEACNPKARISLTTSPFQFVPPSKYENTMKKKKSLLTLQADSSEIAGDYQCLAHYGAFVVASVPWRVTITNVTDFPRQQNIGITVVAGNTVNWRCEPPSGNPKPYVDYYRNGNYLKSMVPMAMNSLIIPNVSVENSGRYTCEGGNLGRIVKSDVVFNLNVVKNGQPERPRFIIRPKEVYHVTKGEDVFLECAAIGNPPPKVIWSKHRGTLPVNRSEMDKFYGGLIIRNVSSTDNGVYECVQMNNYGNVSHSVNLIYQETPSINCLLEETDITQGEDLDLECSVTGTPEPEISWFLNGFVVTNDTKISTDGNKIYFKPAEKRHAGNLQIFARNVVGTVYRSIFIKVIPLSTTQENASDIPVPPTRGNHKRNNRKMNKHGKMVPPSKPTISRISDESVLLRWTVQSNKGLPIQFFKVQYRELGPANEHDTHGRGKASKWMTTNQDIEPHINSYEVANLKPDHYYRFRIAAVYSNNDNKNSPNSEKFFLRRLDFDNRNPLPVPIITHAEPINSTSVKIYWECDRSSNITVEGFFVNYNSAASAADYMKATVDGPDTNSYVLSHLQPDTVYDIKLQSFTTKSASQFSSIKKVKTLGVVSTTTVPPTESPSNIETAGVSNSYIIIAAAVIGGCGVLLGIVGLLIFCRKSKQKKNTTRGDPKTDEHHIQSEVVGSKSGSRPNGCVPSNRITITANPLADADNKNQNMIEMSCLSSQNNNCSSVQASSSGEESPTNSRDKKNKNREKRIRSKNNVDSNAPGENFV